MRSEELNNKLIIAAKWSAITEVVSKFITPLTNMILARIVSPEAFGVVATITMITSFADMLTDAGFQKYLVQYEFKNEEEKYKSASVAFWTNFIVSIILWMTIITLRDKIANLVGNPGLGNVIAISSVQVVLTSFSSIQIALYRRDFDFKTLFTVRIIAICIPFIITIPLAYLGFSYWSIITGSIIMQCLNAIILTLKSRWKPKCFYSWSLLKKMISFSIWSLIEAISIWFTTWIDMFIIGSVLDDYYLGIYRTSTSMVNTVMSLITSSIIPVLFSALSRLQNDNNKFSKFYFNTQKLVAIFMLPMGVGLYLFSDVATKILLGDKWASASEVIGIWSLTSSIMIVFSYFSSEVYRAKGKPKLSFLSQILHLIVLVPVCIISSKYGFEILVYSRAWIRMEAVLINIIIMQLIFQISFIQTLKNVSPVLISTVVMGIIGFSIVNISTNILWSFTGIIIC
ncbi:oligosaccharide flippase family protein, partial [Turicibacter sanguinis]|nr:oligosaccharide flippase family protein [Turicibacter sanguinis]